MSEEPVVRITAPAAKKKPPALGRGLGALMGETRREEPVVAPVRGEGGTATAPVKSGLATLAVSDIEPHPEQPRRHFDEAALEELAASIAQRGVIQPVIVRPLAGGRYQLVAGERRWRAAQKARLHEMPAIVRDLSEREVMALALIENLQREDLNPIEEARAYHRLAESEGLTQAEIARMVDKSRSHVANIQRLLLLPESVMSLVEIGKLSMGHARALIGADGAEALAASAVEKQLSVREVEKLVRKQTRGDSAPSTPRTARAERSSADDADIAAVQGHLEEFLGLPVKILADADPRSGAVTIRYRTLDQLDLICQRLTGGGI
ncbi:ParB/RepB/Spo0J family partition protein [Novosphingobium sp. JCM 18896]|uniref:ParB/RepB/Spo0J family partition protein n=1 Tax=Novosphingobium sp. JCM 18896 TaxID=2989731 RepID=UPI002223BDB1|nr:ParB/RepB/Spo0J family partition protein [Novosphingobium sp. JCM 18896]MCW1429281.1 ParB/RepB/Spo0J family partition protein [Novosphingobium sp. JCM 18896]